MTSVANYGSAPQYIAPKGANLWNLAIQIHQGLGANGAKAEDILKDLKEANPQGIFAGKKVNVSTDYLNILTAKDNQPTVDHYAGNFSTVQQKYSPSDQDLAAVTPKQQVKPGYLQSVVQSVFNRFSPTTPADAKEASRAQASQLETGAPKSASPRAVAETKAVINSLTAKVEKYDQDPTYRQDLEALQDAKADLSRLQAGI